MAALRKPLPLVFPTPSGGFPGELPPRGMHTHPKGSEKSSGAGKVAQAVERVCGWGAEGGVEAGARSRGGLPRGLRRCHREAGRHERWVVKRGPVLTTPRLTALLTIPSGCTKMGGVWHDPHRQATEGHRDLDFRSPHIKPCSFHQVSSKADRGAAL